MSNILKRILHLESMAKSLKREISIAIFQMPDNEEIKFLNDKCFTVSMSSLKDNWTAEFQDFRYQRNCLDALVSRTRLVDVPKALVDALNRKWFMLGKLKVKLHPEMLVHLEEVLCRLGMLAPTSKPTTDPVEELFRK